MDDDIITVKNCRIKYLATKQDKYDNEVVYFRVDNKTVENKFTIINKVGLKLPYFETVDGKFILKSKPKNVKLKELNKDVVINCEIHFKYYKFNDLEGYYVSKLV